MGKGSIQAHIGDGKYSVAINFNRKRAEAAIERMEDRVWELQIDEIPDLENAESEAERTFDNIYWDLNQAIRDGDMETVEELQPDYLETMQSYQKAVLERKSAELEKTSLEKRIQTLQANLPADKVVEAWCADLTTDLSGEVGTVEVPGERQHVQIRPGYDGAAAYDAVRDGQIFPLMSTTPAATFYNLALLPGWQKWRPQYRLGEITAIDTDADTCDVALDEEKSSAQDLDVNQAPALYGIPVEYMTCNAAAFAVGDRVLVEFGGRDWEQPVVIGFESEPQPCSLYCKILLNGHDCTRSHTVRFVQGETVASATTDTAGVVAVPDGIAINQSFYAELFDGYTDGIDLQLFNYLQEVEAFHAEAERFVAGLVDKSDTYGDWQQTLVGFTDDTTVSNEIHVRPIHYKRYPDDILTLDQVSFSEASGEERIGPVINFNQLKVVQRAAHTDNDEIITTGCDPANDTIFIDYSDYLYGEIFQSPSAGDIFSEGISGNDVDRYQENEEANCYEFDVMVSGCERMLRQTNRWIKTVSALEPDIKKYLILTDELGQSVQETGPAYIYYNAELDYSIYCCTYNPDWGGYDTELACEKSWGVHANWQYAKYEAIDTPTSRF